MELLFDTLRLVLAIVAGILGASFLLDTVDRNRDDD